MEDILGRCRRTGSERRNMQGRRSITLSSKHIVCGIASFAVRRMSPGRPPNHGIFTSTSTKYNWVIMQKREAYSAGQEVSNQVSTIHTLSGSGLPAHSTTSNARLPIPLLLLIRLDILLILLRPRLFSLLLFLELPTHLIKLLQNPELFCLLL